MLIFKMLSHLITALVAFALGTGIVAGVRSIAWPKNDPAIGQPTAAETAVNTTNLSGIYYVAPSNGISLSKECLDRAEIRPFGFDSFLEAHQMPAIKRTMRDGRWFMLETEISGDTSYEFVGIIETNKSTVIGKLVRLTKGAITGNTDAVYYNPACSID